MAAGGRKPAAKSSDDESQVDLQSQDVQIAWARIVARAAVDEEFQNRLRGSPADVFEEFGVTLDREINLNADLDPPLDEALAAIERQGAQAAANEPGQRQDPGQAGAANQPSLACATMPRPCACYPTFATQMCITQPDPAQSGMFEGVTTPMQPASTGSNATVSGCFCGQYCSSSASGMGSHGSVAAGDASTTQQALPQNCWGSAFCIGSLGSFGGTAGTVGTGGTYGSAGGAQTAGSTGSMSSTPLGGGITSGGTMSSFGTYGGDPYGYQMAMPKNCNGTFGTAGSIGTVGGTAGSLACVGTFGSAGLGGSAASQATQATQSTASSYADPTGQGMMISWPKNCNGTFGTAGSLGSVGGTAGSLACVGTFGSAGLGASAGSMSSTPLGGGITSGGTQSSFGTYGGDPYAQGKMPENCWGSAFCIGSLGSFGGTAGTVGTGGTYGCAGGAQTAGSTGSMSSTPLGGTPGQQGRVNMCVGSVSCVATSDCVGPCSCTNCIGTVASW